MKPIKDLAEFLENNPRVNQRALTRFNYNLEAIRITVAQARDQLNVMTTKLTPNEYRSISTLVFNLERFLENMDVESIVPATTTPATTTPATTTPEPDFNVPMEIRARRFFNSKGWTSLQFQDDLLPAYEQGFKDGERKVHQDFKLATTNTWRINKLKEIEELQGNINRSMLGDLGHELNMDNSAHHFDASKYLGSDGSGDCQECKEAFDPKPWVKNETL